MTGLEVLTIVDQFQTMIVGVVGFVGVIWTLHASSRSARVEHKRHVASRRIALRRILAAELRNHARALRKNAEAERPNDGLLSVGRIHRLFSEQMSADLGLLEPDEIDIVVNALISLDGLQHVLEHLSSHTTETRFLLPSEAWKDFKAANATTADALEFAIQALEYSGEA